MNAQSTRWDEPKDFAAVLREAFLYRTQARYIRRQQGKMLVEILTAGMLGAMAGASVWVIALALVLIAR